MQYQTLDVRQDGRILRVDFKNPPINLLTITMVQELFDLAGKLTFDPEAAVVLFGSTNPEFFIAHVDINDILRVMNDPDAPQSRYDDINVVQALCTLWESLPQVTISAVDGICRGGGLEFLLATKLRFATAESKFGVPEASGGFLPCGGGTTRLAMQIGPARAYEVVLSARDFTGTEAADYGMINRVVAADELTAYVDDLARRIALRSPGSIAAVNEVFKAVYSSAADALFGGFAVENTAMRYLLSNPSVQEFLKRFASLQDAENERDLPAAIAHSLAAVDA